MLNTYSYWIGTISIWYIAWLLLSILTIPLGSLLFHRLHDRGYPLYRVLGLSVFCYLFFLTTRIGITSVTPTSIYILLALAVLGNMFLKKKARPLYPTLKTIVITEVIFFTLIAVYAFVKGYEPSIHTLEKYMDFGFIQSILTHKTLPPQDPWFASTTSQFYLINYYYFGHFATAFLTTITNLPSTVTYNLMLGSIFASAITMSFSLCYNLYLFLNETVKKNTHFLATIAGILGAYLTNFAGNLQTIYLFTKGYPAENPVPFWTILAKYNPTSYWYPNATRFIPYTIHEFPSYSYVVSDLHGHMLDIPFVLLFLALLMTLVVSTKKNLLLYCSLTLTLGITYMTNSSDFLVYGSLLLFILMIKYHHLWQVLKHYIPVIIGGLLVAMPFSISFIPFAKSIGVNCAPQFLIKLGHLGPLLFEKDKCQTSPFWMMFILWGFFWLNCIAFTTTIFFKKKDTLTVKNKIIYFIFFLFIHSILLTFFAEFFYFKDIYPSHFRANTLFKLGYQAFMMMSLASGVVIVYISAVILRARIRAKLLYLTFLIPMLLLVSIYPYYSVPSYFGNKGFKTLDGSRWVYEAYPDIYEIIQKLNKEKVKQTIPFALVEAHGDSYTDYNIISSYTGIPTVVGWPVHEWLWRGSYDIVAPRAEEVRFIYESDINELPKLKKILTKYHIRFVVITQFERTKYPSLNLSKWYTIAKPIYKKNNHYLFRLNDTY